MSSGKPKEGLAIASLVLGVLAIIPPLMVLTGLPAIITGHVARHRANKQPGSYGGRRMAMAGLITGYLGMTLALGIVVFVTRTARNMFRMQQNFASERCLNNLKQIGLAARVFSEANKYRFPDTFLQMSNELANPHLLRCPADTNHVASAGGGRWNEDAVSYEFVQPGIQEAPDSMDTVVFRCRIHGYVVTVDGTVRTAAPSSTPPTQAQP
jgi:hypothetical protein